MLYLFRSDEQFSRMGAVIADSRTEAEELIRAEARDMGIDSLLFWPATVQPVQRSRDEPERWDVCEACQ